MAKRKKTAQLKAFLAAVDEPEETDLAASYEALGMIFEAVAAIEREATRIDTKRQAALMVERDHAVRDKLAEGQRIWGPLTRFMSEIRKSAQNASQHLDEVGPYLNGHEEVVEGERQRVGGVRRTVEEAYS